MLTHLRVRKANWAVILWLVASYAAAAEPQIPIVIGTGASEAEKFAAEELRTRFQHLYPNEHFSVATSVPNGTSYILLGTLKSQPRLARHVPAAGLAKPESFVVSTAKEGDTEIGVIAGADPRGALYGVYGLLEKLGYGFYLSYNTEPPPRSGPFRLTDWKAADAPLFPDRAVFPWHNFLSGSSAWDLPDWERWMTQIGRMRYNTVMVHCYGNSPIFTFDFRGRSKPVGYFTSTTKGREWGTQHVNDVRRLFGGESFTDPVFGAKISMVPDAQRTEAAIGLMQQVFKLAHSRGFHVSFVLDVETPEMNPQELIRQLPPGARLGRGECQLANPDTPEGYEYYRAEISTLMKLYPQIDRLILFYRFQEIPWRDIKVQDFPEAWQAQFTAALEKNPRLRRDPKAVPMFVLAKMAAAVGRVLRELGRGDVELSGSAFAHEFLPAADPFLPPEVSLVMMDQTESIEAAGFRELLESVGAHRKLYPVFWANHDGRGYLIRPHTPYQSFSTFLRSANCTGLSIIHWDTRPMDIYFKSLGAQLWQATRDQPLVETAREMAAHTFGESARQTGGEYLLRWATDAPTFARETSDRFVTSILKDPPDVAAKCQERLDLLAKVGQGQLTPSGRQWVEYYSGLERFVIAFFESQTAYEQAQALREEGRLDKARQALAGCKPEAVIQEFARVSSLGSITKGEQGIIVSMNLRWLPYITSERQAEGIEPVRLRFEPTFHDPLAMDGGANTFYFDKERRLWKGLGEQETGMPVFVESPDAPTDEVCSTGVKIEQKILGRGLIFRLGPIMGDKLPPGRYTAHLIFAPRPAYADITLQGSPTLLPATEKLTIPSGGTQPVQITRTLEVTQGAVRVMIFPTFGTVFLCGAILEPAAGARGDVARPGGADDAFAKENIRAIMHKVNDYQREHPSHDPEIDAGYEWSRATYYTGVMAFYRATGETKLLDQAIRWANDRKWQPGPEVPGPNKLTCTQTYLEIFLVKRDPNMIAPTIRWVNSGEPASPTGAKAWYFCWGVQIPDSLYVAPPALAMLSEATGDQKYLEPMDACFWDSYEVLFDKEAGFFYETKDFIAKKSASGKKIFWSRGNGWAMAGIPRILEHLPKEHPSYPRYVNLLKTMAAAAAKAQGEDGLWRANLADPGEFPNKESSGTGFFCYALAWGINNGILDRDTYLPVVRKAWSGLVPCVSPEGQVQWGQLVSDRPADVKQEDSHEYVAGIFLLAGSEMLKLECR